MSLFGANPHIKSSFAQLTCTTILAHTEIHTATTVITPRQRRHLIMKPMLEAGKSERQWEWADVTATEHQAVPPARGRPERHGVPPWSAAGLGGTAIPSPPPWRAFPK